MYSYLEFPDNLAGIFWAGEGLLVVDGKVDEGELGIQDGEGPGRAARGDVEHSEGSGQLAVDVRYHRELDPPQPGQNIIHIMCTRVSPIFEFLEV